VKLVSRGKSDKGNNQRKYGEGLLTIENAKGLELSSQKIEMKNKIQMRTNRLVGSSTPKIPLG
jgi:hypothetical protein